MHAGYALGTRKNRPPIEDWKNKRLKKTVHNLALTFSNDVIYEAHVEPEEDERTEVIH